MKKYEKQIISFLRDDDIDIELQTKNSVPITITYLRNGGVREWIIKNKNHINNALTFFGAILLRKFDVASPEDFNKLFVELVGDSLDYKNQTSPREQVCEGVYTSTSYPNDQVINMHTENSYSRDYPGIISFYCMKPARTGGATPIADERKLLSSLREKTVSRFREKGIMYERNILPDIGLNWQTVYQTGDRMKVNEILKRDEVNFKWVTGDHLRIKWTLPAFQHHPITMTEMWFNHAYFYHKSLYDPELLEYFENYDIPFATLYGDGTTIEDSVIQEIKDFYSNNTIFFNWEEGDFLLLDNMSFSHGRMPYEGERCILTAMGRPQRF
ncbi:MAG: TauD/TfdA family dioxygenase [Balneolaceae bacterium]